MILEHPLSDEERSFLNRVAEFARSEIMPHADRWEAFRARSKPEFVSKCGDCLKEAEETNYWLELLVDAELVLPEKLAPLRQECDELTAIFVSIIKSSRHNAATS